jgi:hypothetical protein
MTWQKKKGGAILRHGGRFRPWFTTCASRRSSWTTPREGPIYPESYGYAIREGIMNSLEAGSRSGE